MKSKDDISLMEAYSKVWNEQEQKVSNEITPEMEKEMDVASEAMGDYDEEKELNMLLASATNLLKNSKDQGMKDNLNRLIKGINSERMSKEITKTSTGNEPQENLTRAQYAMSGYSGPNS
jgi:hypothetical protein